ncbi:hypothetical protein O9G_002540, partial [Rozella allomycis CSF55]
MTRCKIVKKIDLFELLDSILSENFTTTGEKENKPKNIPTPQNPLFSKIDPRILAIKPKITYDKDAFDSKLIVEAPETVRKQSSQNMKTSIERLNEKLKLKFKEQRERKKMEKMSQSEMQQSQEEENDDDDDCKKSTVTSLNFDPNIPSDGWSLPVTDSQVLNEPS